MKVREGFKFFLSFLLMFTFLAFFISLFVNIKILNPNFYKSKLASSSYYELLNQQLEKEYKVLSISTGIPEEVFTQNVTPEILQGATDNNIENTINYIKYKTEAIDSSYDTEGLEKKVYDNLNKYLEGKNMKLTPEQKEQLSKVTKDFSTITSNHSDLFNLGAVSKLSQFQTFRKILYTIGKSLWLISALILILTLFIVLLSKDNYNKLFLWLGSSLIPAGIILLVPSTAALVTRIPYRLGIGLPYLKQALQIFALGFINYFLAVSIGAIVIGIAFLVIYNYNENVSL